MILQATASSDLVITVAYVTWGFIVWYKKATWVKLAAPRREFI